MPALHHTEDREKPAPAPRTRAGFGHLDPTRVAPTRVALALTALLGAAAACGDDVAERPRQPAGWDQGIRGPEARDTNPADGVVEVSLRATPATLGILPGTTTPMWTYDGGVPGPLIRARVGDRVIVHFTNDLPEETTIHWHGVRLTADMDGTPDHSQPPVPPGGTFDYSFVVPDASLFWYHPHTVSAKQVGHGLYGPLLVEDPAEIGTAAAAATGAVPPFGDEVVLVLSDADVLEDGSLQDPEAGGGIATLFGREGNALMVNGRVKPTLLARRGLPQRWRIVNAARSRYYQLAMAGHSFTRIGNDGGLLPAAVASDTVLVIPGGRADVVVVPNGQPGDVVPVRWVAYDRGWGTAYNRPDDDVFYVKITADPAVTPPARPTVLREIAPLPTEGAVERNIQLTQAVDTGTLILGIDGVPSWLAQPFHAVVGQTDSWTIENTMLWDHPFHLHGFFFQEVDLDTGVPLPGAGWLDTFNVPAKQIRRMIARYDDRPGMWMFHCHILDHADAGMMGMLMVHPAGDAGGAAH